jgi:drug/metabolite transporter (DMT)-like permease
VGLSEVLFAAVFAWLGLGQHLHSLQILGGVLVLIGIGIVRADEPPLAADPELDDLPGVSAHVPAGVS